MGHAKYQMSCWLSPNTFFFLYFLQQTRLFVSLHLFFHTPHSHALSRTLVRSLSNFSPFHTPLFHRRNPVYLQHEQSVSRSAMKFGDNLENSTYAPWKDYYVQYNVLKRQLEDGLYKPSGWTERDEGIFGATLDGDLTKVWKADTEQDRGRLWRPCHTDPLILICSHGTRRCSTL